MRSHTRKHAHNTTKHCKLSGPDWGISDQMLDRTIDAIARRVTVCTDYHVPYLAGYSSDGKTIYIDQDLPQSFVNRDGDTVMVHRYLMLHESVEKSLIDALHMHYQHAHQVALRTEKAAVLADGVSWTEYDAFMQTWIKVAEDSHSLKLPPDLDLRPYIDEHDAELLDKMRATMKKVRSSERLAAKSSERLPARISSRRALVARN